MKFNFFCCFNKKADEEPKKIVKTTKPNTDEEPKEIVKTTKPSADEKFVFKPEPVAETQKIVIQRIETDSNYAVALAKKPKDFFPLSPDIKLALAIRISSDGRINETHTDVARVLTSLKYENLAAQKEAAIVTRRRAGK